METTDKSSGQGGGGGLPPSGRYSVFSQSNNSSFNVKPEPILSPLPPKSPVGGSEMGHFGVGKNSDAARFSHDVSRMPDNPPKNLGHRRAHSEILTLPDDISFDSDLGVVGVTEGPSLSDDTEEDLFSMYLDLEKLNSSSATSTFQLGEPSSSQNMPSTEIATDRRVRHQHSQSMDDSTAIKAEMLITDEEASIADSKKAMSAAKLAELALIDPKRAKRIWANRQSAARSKERKMRYIAELERKVQTLQTEATSLSAQLTLLQRDTNGLTAENSELKLRVQSMEQQVHLQDALNEALKEEIHHLKVMTGQASGGNPMVNFAMMNANSGQHHRPQFYPTNTSGGNQAMHAAITAQQFQHLNIRHAQPPQQQQQQRAFHYSPHQFPPFPPNRSETGSSSLPDD